MRESRCARHAANFSALLYHSLADLNWAGFYFYDGTELVVGPFQGKPACVRTYLREIVPMCGRPASNPACCRRARHTGYVERLGFMPISDAELPPAVLPSPAFHGDRDDAGTLMKIACNRRHHPCAAAPMQEFKAALSVARAGGWRAAAPGWP